MSKTNEYDPGEIYQGTNIKIDYNGISIRNYFPEEKQIWEFEQKDFSDSVWFDDPITLKELVDKTYEIIRNKM